MRFRIAAALVSMFAVAAAYEGRPAAKTPMAVSTVDRSPLVRVVDVRPTYPGLGANLNPFALPPPAGTIFNNPFWFDITVTVTYLVGGVLSTVDVVVVPGLSAVNVPGTVISIEPKDSPGITIENCSIPTAGPKDSTILLDGWCIGCSGAEPTPPPFGTIPKPNGDAVI